MQTCAILILSGGKSTRFGSDKLCALASGKRVIDHTTNAFATLKQSVFEAGRGYTTATLIDDTVGIDPLSAIARSWTTILTMKIEIPDSLMVISGDLPNLDSGTLIRLMEFPGTWSVVPDDGQLQPLCARWSTKALERSIELCEGTTGAVAVKRALNTGTVLLRDQSWSESGIISPFFDIDTVDDLAILEKYWSTRGHKS